MGDRRPVEVRVLSSLPGWPEARLVWEVGESTTESQPADLIEALMSAGVACSPTTSVSDEPGYFVEFRAGDDLCSCFIGFDVGTTTLLERWATNLDGDRRVAIRSVADSIARRLDPDESAALDRGEEDQR